MAKRFKLKISRLLLSFRLCRSIKASNLPDIPFPFIRRLSPVNATALGVGYRNLNLPAPPPPTPDLSVIKRHLSPKIASATRNKMENDSHMETKKKKTKKKKPSNAKMVKRMRTFGSKKHGGDPLWRAEGKVRESVAVVKRLEDPYEDFNGSMMEMIMEKQMFQVEELKQQLLCFLSLNSIEFHGIIVEAFIEIWEALFYEQ
ncbi:Transcription repressor OFP6 [Hibiscus syriacus]|uniref:Transcription repressor n=1 Tax=Hibiscus syriacus TaxID=106335 RepID=A0A6A3BAL6_HIBSY|nr:transcription repressor OFP7-like [Hibiscus syriacus]KAE8712585.1 Transcription repressor OFP6 [Hibiscus syriacus]